MNIMIYCGRVDSKEVFGVWYTLHPNVNQALLTFLSACRWTDPTALTNPRTKGVKFAIFSEHTRVLHMSKKSNGFLVVALVFIKWAITHDKLAIRGKSLTINVWMCRGPTMVQISKCTKKNVTIYPLKIYRLIM